ncbi:MAG: hypothetical protein VKL39_12695 [Leptolyngbyaceae bacterium]|nr:hypothetical protein [Leptolyngbyaceae bacterium]
MKAIHSIALFLSVSTLSLGAIAQPSTSAPLVNESRKAIDVLVELCESAGDSDARFRCLLTQGERLNRAKNLARQRGEQENGGVTFVETEPSMHGPSSESPYTISTPDDQIEYRFTFRMRPRATEDYTQQAEILVTYSTSTRAWDVITVSNEAIAPTPCSYSDEQRNVC